MKGLDTDSLGWAELKELSLVTVQHVKPSCGPDMTVAVDWALKADY